MRKPSSEGRNGPVQTMLHRIANGIIEEAAENGCTIIAFEE